MILVKHDEELTKIHNLCVSIFIIKDVSREKSQINQNLNSVQLHHCGPVNFQSITLGGVGFKQHNSICNVEIYRMCCDKSVEMDFTWLNMESVRYGKRQGTLKNNSE